MKIDFDHYKGAQVGDEILNNLQEQRMLQMINLLSPTFSKDGNQFCYLYGENLQIGIAGFGDTPYEAMVDFYKAYTTEKIISKPVEIGTIKRSFKLCVDVWGQNKDSLTKDKEYIVIKEAKGYFIILDDNGRKKKYKNNNTQFL